MCERVPQELHRKICCFGASVPLCVAVFQIKRGSSATGLREVRQAGRQGGLSLIWNREFEKEKKKKGKRRGRRREERRGEKEHKGRQAGREEKEVWLLR